MIAAERLNTSQPALSRMATAPEAQIGAPIFSLRRNPVTPTALGSELANHGRSIRTRRNRYRSLPKELRPANREISGSTKFFLGADSAPHLREDSDKFVF